MWNAPIQSSRRSVCVASRCKCGSSFILSAAAALSTEIDLISHWILCSTRFDFRSVVSSGDAGANGRNNAQCKLRRLLPDFPAASPYVTTVGGTQVNNPKFNLPNPPSFVCGSQYSVSLLLHGSFTRPIGGSS